MPEELYNSLRVLGYQKKDMEREFLENVVLQLYAKHTISMGKGASILGLSIQAFRETLLRKQLPVEYLTEDAYEENLKVMPIRLLQEKQENLRVFQ